LIEKALNISATLLKIGCSDRVTLNKGQRIGLNMDLQVGSHAPNFSLKDSQGNLVNLKDFRGQWVVLYFYPRDLTPGCTDEACGFRDLYAELQADNVIVLGISGDDEKSHQKFITKHNLPFPLLCDITHEVATAYGCFGEKKFMGKTFDGIYRHTFLIAPDGKLAKIYRKVKPKEHAAQILDDLTPLLAVNP
jgi:thioredoxin-dependent peroxiredoxin